MTFAVWQRVTWHNSLAGLLVWAKTKGAWQPAVIHKLGRTRALVRFEDDRFAFRPYSDLAYRKIKNNGSDMPQEESKV